nr:hypothetical protein [Tanacetum cinerariifolium]
ATGGRCHMLVRQSCSRCCLSRCLPPTHKETENVEFKLLMRRGKAGSY